MVKSEKEEVKPEVVSEAVQVSTIRKIVMIGNSYYISIPKQWLLKHSLNTGDSLVVIIDDVLVAIPFKHFEIFKNIKSFIEGVSGE